MKFRGNWQIYSTSFMTEVFPSALKIAKVVPVFKKDSKLDYSNYRPMSLLWNIEKLFKRFKCRKDCIPFLIIIIYNL